MKLPLAADGIDTSEERRYFIDERRNKETVTTIVSSLQSPLANQCNRFLIQFGVRLLAHIFDGDVEVLSNLGPMRSYEHPKHSPPTRTNRKQVRRSERCMTARERVHQVGTLLCALSMGIRTGMQADRQSHCQTVSMMMESIMRVKFRSFDG